MISSQGVCFLKLYRSSFLSLSIKPILAKHMFVILESVWVSAINTVKIAYLFSE